MTSIDRIDGCLTHVCLINSNRSIQGYKFNRKSQDKFHTIRLLADYVFFGADCVK